MPSAMCSSPPQTSAKQSAVRARRQEVTEDLHDSPGDATSSTAPFRRPRAQSAPALDRRELLAVAQSLYRTRIEYVPHESFTEPSPNASLRNRRATLRTPAEPEDHSDAPLTFDDPERLLTRDEEFSLFRRMNHLKHRAEQLRAQLNPRRPKARDVELIAQLLGDAVAIRNRIIAANVRLVVSVAKHHVDTANTLGELVSDGHMSLMRAVEKFDFSRGYRFSTYATWALRYNFNRATATRRRRQQRFVSGEDHMLEAACDDPPEISAASRRQLKQSLAQLLEQLDARERRIITFRFGLAGERSPATLAQLATKLGVCKERVRQLEARALGKLRELAAVKHLEPPE